MERVGLLRRAGAGKLVAVAMVAGVCTLAGARNVQAQTPPPAQTPAPAPQDKPDPLKFNTDSPVLLLLQVKADKTADFEAAMTSIRGAFGKATKPEIKTFGDTMSKFYKVDAGGGGAQPVAIYILQLDAPSKAYSYDLGKTVYETLMGDKALSREEADAIYGKLRDSIANINFWTLVKAG